MHKKKKLKIIFVINNFQIGGVEKLLYEIISTLPKSEFDIKIITVFGTGPLEASFRDLGIKIYFAGLPESFIKKLPKDLAWTISTFFIILRVAFFFIKSKPDVVVTSLFHADVIGMIAAKIARVKKRILIQHDTVEFQKFVYVVKKDFVVKYPTQIIAVSNTVKHFMVNYFKADEKKILTVFNGIDYAKFIAGKKELLESDSPVVGVVGRLEEIKGHIHLLEALKILKTRYNVEPKVLLAGDGSLRAMLEKYTKENKLSNVEFLGSTSDVPGFLAKIDILVVPSESEGFGLVVLEGMVSRKAIIASDIEVMHELIIDGKNGLLFKNRDSSSLAIELLKIYQDKNQLEQLQKGALLFTKENRNKFDINEVAKAYRNLFIKR